MEHYKKKMQLGTGFDAAKSHLRPMEKLLAVQISSFYQFKILHLNAP
jgi:hypothetical protein